MYNIQNIQQYTKYKFKRTIDTDTEEICQVKSHLFI